MISKSINVKTIKTAIIILAVVVFIFAAAKMYASYKAYNLIDLEDPNIYCGMTFKDLQEYKGSPKTKERYADTGLEEFTYEGEYKGFPAQITYSGKSKIDSIFVEIKSLTGKQGKEVFAYTKEICRSQARFGQKYKEKLIDNRNFMKGFISIPCAKYGVQLDIEQTKEFRWQYERGTFTLAISNPVGAII
ncbi:MAG: hypothetical protein ACRCUS_09230 [Anaerovoracaceae bacterium]